MKSILAKVKLATALLAASVVGMGCGMDDKSGGLTGDKKEVDVGEVHQTLVPGPNGTMVPACSVNYSRCIAGSSTRYEQCAWSVEVPGTEDWFQGQCDGGYTCEQQGLEARCVSTGPDQNRTIRCDEVNGSLRVTITGPIVGGTVLNPATPNRLAYATDEDGRNDGWYIPYPSATRRTSLTTNGAGVGPYVITLIPEASRFNFYLKSSSQSSTPSANPPNYWFRLDDDTWTVRGACHKEWISGSGWALRRDADSSEPDPDPNPPSSQAPGTIVCTRTSNRLVMSIRGPVQARTMAAQSGGSVPNASLIVYGANLPWPSVWNEADIYRLSTTGSNRRASAAFNSDTGTYRLELPRDASEINLILWGNSSTAQRSWFDLNRRSNGTYPWDVSGDCYISNRMIYQR